MLVGFTILKKDNKEKKICTIYVKKKYRKMGIGKTLFIKAFCWLDNEKPLITISKINMHYYTFLIKYFGFKLINIDKYKTLEFIYNDS